MARPAPLTGEIFPVLLRSRIRIHQALKTMAQTSITLTTDEAGSVVSIMSDTRSLSIVRDAGASENTSTFLVAHSTYDGEMRPGRSTLRAQRVNRLRQAIVRGDYRADPRRIAIKLLKRS